MNVATFSGLWVGQDVIEDVLTFSVELATRNLGIRRVSSSIGVFLERTTGLSQSVSIKFPPLL